MQDSLHYLALLFVHSLFLQKTGNYRAAIDLSGKVLTDLGQGFGCATQESKNTPETLKVRKH